MNRQIFAASNPISHLCTRNKIYLQYIVVKSHFSSVEANSRHCEKLVVANKLLRIQKNRCDVRKKLSANIKFSQRTVPHYVKFAANRNGSNFFFANIWLFDLRIKIFRTFVRANVSLKTDNSLRTQQTIAKSNNANNLFSAANEASWRTNSLRTRCES